MERSRPRYSMYRMGMMTRKRKMRTSGEQKARPRTAFPAQRSRGGATEEPTAPTTVSFMSLNALRAGSLSTPRPPRGLSNGCALLPGVEDRLDPSHRLFHRLLVAPLLRHHPGDGLAPDVLGVHLRVGRVIAVVEREIGRAS